VAEAEFRASKVFTRSKKGLLALYGTDLHVVDVLGLEAAESNGLADVTQHVLRWVNYINVRFGILSQQALSSGCFSKLSVPYVALTAVAPTTYIHSWTLP
jgi:hypothetical protein